VNDESATPAGRRRSRREVEADVRSALVRLLDEGKPFKDLTVDELARAAGLSRTAFYFYFPGKSQALMAAAAEVAEETAAEADRWWHGEGDPEELVRVALQGIVDVYVRHSSMLRTAVEVTTYDPEFAAFYNQLMERFVRATADQLRRDRDAGLLRDVDPDAVAESLVWMVERYNNVFLGTQGRAPDAHVHALTSVWVHALYPDSVVAQGS
jgi:TetR/AcrR family transcriptional regulator, ethionamide resistance regulator